MGEVSGRTCAKATKPNAKPVYRYAKIPFAKPPVGKLRFQPPQEAVPWKGVLDGTKRGPMPIQPLSLKDMIEDTTAFTNEFDEDFSNSSEDCLYLDVYTTSVNPKADKMPVLFWVYGGGFQIGSSKNYDGSVLASLHDVVVVVPNYRVNIFGFLSMAGGADSPCKGNMGLLDQAMALKWVNKNIASFGGNPGNVTLMGESAGSISVGLHLASPLTKNWYHRAISHSGVSDYRMLVCEDNETTLKKYLAALGIDGTDTNEAFKKLVTLPTKDIVKVINPLIKEFAYFGVVKKDGEFLPERPEDVVEKSGFSTVPYIVGVNSSEGCGIIAMGKELGFDDGLPDHLAKMFMQGIMSPLIPPEKNDQLQAALLEEYGRGLDAANDKLFWSKVSGEMSGDQQFVMPSLKMAAKHADAQVPTYFYQMTQTTAYKRDAAYNRRSKPVLQQPLLCECDHFDDITYTFGIPLSGANLLFDVEFTEEERKFSELWMNYIVNFATTGNPNEGPQKIPVQWPTFKDRKYLDVSSRPKVDQNLKSERVKFWAEIFSKL